MSDDDKQYSQSQRDDFYARRQGRNKAIAFALGGMVVLFFLVSIVKMGGA